MSPFTIEKHKHDAFCHVTLDGEATVESIIESMHTMVEDETYQRTQRIVVQTGPAIGLQSPVLNMRRVEQYVKSNEHLFTGSRWAVVTSSMLYYGISRMYVAWRHDATYELAVFRDVPDAAAWLTR